MPNIISFTEAIEHSRQFKKRHLLLGNGFSISLRPKIFTYGSLLAQADFATAPLLPKLFEALGTTDFEHVIKALDDASRAIPIYAPTFAPAAAQMAQDANKLKDILVETVAHNHPNIPNEIPDEHFWGCRRFLAHFLGPENDTGRVYTLILAALIGSE